MAETGNVTEAARSLGINRNTAFSWARPARPDCAHSHSNDHTRAARSAAYSHEISAAIGPGKPGEDDEYVPVPARVTGVGQEAAGRSML